MLQPDIRALVEIGHVHLRVTDLERSTAFYRDVLGFRVTVDGRPLGLPAVLLTAGDYYHHIALTTFGGVAAALVPRGYAGLKHFAILYPDPLSLAEAVVRLFDREYPISHAADHGGTVSIYLVDPDGNGIELYYDRPHVECFGSNGGCVVRSEPFDPADLLEVLARRPAA
jgi:catechol 2,3-dioxygenase